MLVTGASGILGRAVMQAAAARGIEATGVSRSTDPRCDLTDPESVRAACAGADLIIHSAADPFGQAAAVEVDAMHRLREAAPDARIVYPSIVGCDKINFSYYKVKRAAEQALAEAGGDHAILRLTQFHEFADRLARLPMPMVFAGMRAQTISAREAAEALLDVALGDKQGLVGDVGGPEIHRMKDLIRQRLRADGRRRPILVMPMGYRGFKAGYNLCPDARVGEVTWAEHMGEGKKAARGPRTADPAS